MNPRPYPDVLTTGARHVDIVGSGSYPAGMCLTVKFSRTSVTVGEGIMAAAYSSFNPANPGENWLADSGTSLDNTLTSVVFEFVVPPSGQITIVVFELDPDSASTADGGAGTGWFLRFWTPQPASFGSEAFVNSTDKAVYRPSTGQWFVRGGSPEVAQYGVAGDYAVPADYNGDSFDNRAIYRTSTGQWIIREAHPVPEVVQYGAACNEGDACRFTGDIPVPADYDGDADDEIAVYRPISGQWFIRGRTPEVTQYGTPCAQPCYTDASDDEYPVPGDYDGNGLDEIAVFRKATGQWFVKGRTPEITQYGTPGDVPVPADYDGDGDTDFAVYRPSTGQWFVRGGSPEVTQYGVGDDVPSPGDYTADGRTDKAIYRIGTGQWFVRGGSPEVTQYGMPNDVPLPLPFAVRRHYFSS